MSNNNEFIAVVAQHIDLLTTDIAAYNHPWPERSKWVGYSALAYVLPSFFVRGWTLAACAFRAIWLVQAAFVFSSDYAWATDVHVLHGIDRWLATLLTLYMMYVTVRYSSIWYLVVGIIPLYSIYMSKIAARTQDWNLYVVSQTVWHITGPLIACIVLRSISEPW